jgi:antirestriction protein ArdC
MKQDIYSKVTNQIIEQLENGSAPWLKPWQSSGTAATASMPHNAATGRAYSGINVMLLWAAPYATHSRDWQRLLMRPIRGNSGRVATC